MSYMNQWAQHFAETINGEFRAEMRKRGKESTANASLAQPSAP